MVHYKFYYFTGRGLGEITRQLFALAGVEYEDVRFTAEEWPAHKDNMPLKQLPVLEVDGQQIPQSWAIARYVARKYGFAGKTPFEEAIVDALADSYKDFYSEIRSYYYNCLGLAPGDKDQLRKDVLIPARDKYLGLMTDFLKKSSSGFLAGGEITFADLILAESTFTQISFFPDYAKDFPEILAHHKKVSNVPKLKEWLETRPVTPF